MKTIPAPPIPPQLRVDPRGIMLSRSLPDGRGEFEGVLVVLISCDGSPPIAFSFEIDEERASPGSMVYRGSFPDPSAGISCTLTLTAIASIEGYRAELEVENTSDDVPVRFEVRLLLPGEADPHWLIPGLFYGENRLPSCERLYPGYSEIKRDPTRFWSNHWSFRSDRAALPAVFCSTYSGTAFIAVEEIDGQTPNTPLGIAMTSLGLSSEDGQVVLSASLPAIEEPVRAASSSGDVSATVATLPLERGVPVRWHFELAVVPGEASERDRLLRALYLDRWGRHPLRPKVGSLEAERLAVDGIRSWHFDDESKLLRERSLGEQQATDSNPFRIGERNGVLPAFVLLWYGRDNKDAAPVREAHDLLDSISQCIAPCGSFFEDFGTSSANGVGARTARRVHARPAAEAVLFLVRALRLEMQAHTAHPLWSGAVVSNIDFIVSAQREDGAFPTAWNAETGDVSSWDGTDGIAWIASLAAAGQVTASRTWLDAARRGGLHYRHAVEDGFLTGSLDGQDGIPSCEAAHWALISYIILYEADHDPLWLDLAKRSADIALSWRMSHNVTFAPSSMLAQSGISTFGGDILSAATPLLGPWGLISYGELLRLSALTEDDFYEQRAREGRLYVSQLLARADGEFNLRRGQTLGPISCTDGVIPKGLAMKESLVWVNALAAYAELIERNQMISREALSGNRKSVEEMTLRASSVTIKPDLELPETVASRRSRESGTRRLPSTVRHAAPATRSSHAPTPRVFDSREESTPMAPEGSSKGHGQGSTRNTPSSVVRMPSFPEEIHEPRRSAAEDEGTEGKPSRSRSGQPGLHIAGEPSSGMIVPDEATSPVPPPRIPGMPVGQDPYTKQNVFVSSGVMAANLRRQAEERERDRIRRDAERKREVPVHRGYRAPSGTDGELNLQGKTPPPEHLSHESVPEKLWMERPLELPKWHVYQYGLEHVKPHPEEEKAAPMPERISKSVDLRKLNETESTVQEASRRAAQLPKIPLSERHRPLDKDDVDSIKKKNTESPKPKFVPVPPREDSNPYRLPTGAREDIKSDGHEGESPGDPSSIKWKIF